ncbi:MAG: SH3 domain-containing protein [Gemmatimonadales bacterium]
MPVRLGLLLLAAVFPITACAPKKPEAAPRPAPRRSTALSQSARAELDRRIARLELALMEKEAQVDDLQSRLDATRQEVVRAMAKLQTLATRAEAASGMAEAELALQPLKTVAGQPSAPEAEQARRLLQESSAEFEKENYGGALYLANQAKTMAAAGRGRLTLDERVTERPGETPFDLPIELTAVSGGNVREGPGLNAKIAFEVQPGDSLTGYSYVDEWIRISDEAGRGGWIFRTLITRR